MFGPPPTDGNFTVSDTSTPSEPNPIVAAGTEMSDPAEVSAFDDLDGPDVLIERALLNASEAGRKIQASFIDVFGRYMRDEVRPLLRNTAGGGEQPQLLVNGLAELLRSVAIKIEFPLDHPRAGFPPQGPTSGSD